MSRTNSLFFSYGHDRNSQLVLDYLKPALEKVGFKIWVDKTEIKTGDDWRDSIVNGLEKSNGVIAYLSKYSVRDPGVCRDELRIARSISGCKIITVMLESPAEVQPPLTVSHIQYLDMSEWKKKLEQGESIFNEWFCYKFAELKEAIEKNSDLPGLITEIRHTIKPALDSNSYVGDLENLLSEKIISRNWIVKKVEDWQNNKDGNPVFCLTGEPGFGKSVVSAIIATECKLNAIGIHFCKINSGFNDAKTIFTQLCFQVATKVPSYARALASDEFSWEQANANDVFEKAFVELPKRSIDGNREKSFLIIDALDEAPEELVEILSKNSKKLPKWLGFFVTSRPNEANIKNFLEEFSTEFLDSSDNNNLNDVNEFINEQIENLDIDKDLKYSFARKLSLAANGNFRYVSVFLNSINKKNCDEIISNLIKGKNVFPKSLNELYDSSFKRLFKNIDYYREEISPILGLLSVSKYPVPLDYLTFYLNASEKIVLQKLKKLNSMIRISSQNNVISLFHRSVRDWLLSNESEFSVDKKETEEQFFASIADFLDSLLDNLDDENLENTEDSPSSSAQTKQIVEENKDDIDDILNLENENTSFVDDTEFEEDDDNEEEYNVAYLVTFFILSFPILLRKYVYSEGKFNQEIFSNYFEKNLFKKLCSKLDDLKSVSQIFDSDSENYSNDNHQQYLIFIKLINKLAIDLFGKESIEDQKASLELANILFWEFNDFENSEKLYKRVLKLNEKNKLLSSSEILEIIKNEAISASSNYKYNVAEELFEDLLKNKDLTKNEELYFTVLVNYADCLRKLGQYTNALSIYDKCISFAEKNSEKLDTDAKLTALNNRAGIYSDLSEYTRLIQESESILEHAIKLGVNESDVALYKLNLAHAYSHQDKFEEAFSLINQAKVSYEKIYGEDSKEFITVLESLSNYYNLIGDLKNAIKIQRDVIEITKNFYGDSSGDYIEANLGLVDLLSQQDEQSEIKSIMEEMEKNVESKFGLLNPLSWEFYCRLSNYYVDIENYDRAISIFEQILESMGSSNVDDLKQLEILQLVAHVYNMVGDEEKAITTFKRCLEIQEKNYGDKSNHYLHTLSNIAGIYRSNEEFEKADSIYKDVLNGCKELNGSNSKEYLEHLVDYADFLGDQDPDEGSKLLQECLQKIEKSLGKNSEYYYEVLESYADTLSTSEDILDDEEQVENIIKIYKKILKYKSEKYGSTSSKLVHSIASIAELYEEIEKEDSAIKLIKSYLKSFEEKFGPKHSSVLTLKRILAEIYVETDKTKTGINILRDLVEDFSDYYGPMHHETVLLKATLYNDEDLYINFKKDDFKYVNSIMDLYREVSDYYGEEYHLTKHVAEHAITISLANKKNIDWIEKYCLNILDDEKKFSDKVDHLLNLAECYSIKKDYKNSLEVYEEAFSICQDDNSQIDESLMSYIEMEITKTNFVISHSKKDLNELIKLIKTSSLNEEDPLKIEKVCKEIIPLAKELGFEKESKKLEKNLEKTENEDYTSAENDEELSYLLDGISYQQFKDISENIKLFFKETCEIPDFENTSVYLYYRFASARVSWGLKKDKEAIKISTEIISKIKTLPNQENKTFNDIFLSCIALLGKIYFYQFDMQKSIEYFSEWLSKDKDNEYSYRGEKLEITALLTEANLILNGAVNIDDIHSLEQIKSECEKISIDKEFEDDLVEMLNNDIGDLKTLESSTIITNEGKIKEIIEKNHNAKSFQKEVFKYMYKNPLKRKLGLMKTIRALLPW